MTDGPPRLRDRRKLVAALRQLSRGLRNGDDPLYDPWQGPQDASPAAPTWAGRRRAAKMGQEFARPLSGQRWPSPPRAKRVHFRQRAVQWLSSQRPWEVVVLTAVLVFVASAALLIGLAWPGH